MRKFLLSLLGILLLLSNQLYAQDVNITGKVIADDGSALPGVNIAVKSTANGTTTDVQGNYNIQVSQGATLIFSFIGFTSKEVIVGNQSVINVTLAAGPNQLSEVVVTALGAVREKRSLRLCSFRSEW